MVRVEDMEDAEAAIKSALDILNARSTVPSAKELALLINQKGWLQLHQYQRGEDCSHLYSTMKEFSHADDLDKSNETCAYSEA